MPLVAYPGDVPTLPSWSVQVTQGLIAADTTFESTNGWTIGADSIEGGQASVAVSALASLGAPTRSTLQPGTYELTLEQGTCTAPTLKVWPGDESNEQTVTLVAGAGTHVYTLSLLAPVSGFAICIPSGALTLLSLDLAQVETPPDEV